ncbi:hypothetical protein FOA43_003515 [Brettanomyces nanus]|uniref:Zn(2)-C6 fungal-type domain-containing protein n=1 Tax=Eeniella nana TaxID=13502 RepID=A0A875S8Y6_EENNA|nr:uncharacterized protein FOA43_003515 [Brettanomyces nanus]QPG76129.1 hypothetical protein FOA43_003515 [Brettanomyces nanus]
MSAKAVTKYSSGYSPDEHKQKSVSENSVSVTPFVSASSSSSSSASSASSAWNIIKNPSSGRTRIGQACDRCRARKIKCSGKSETNPRCTNCEKDGFQCIVSDKLTRNSFPKGYTKNLEKKLLEVELDRNKLSLKLKDARKMLFELQDKVSSCNHQDNYDEKKKLSDVGGSVKNFDDQPKDMQLLEPKARDTHITSCSALLDTFQTDCNGLLVLDQFMVLPFDKFLTKLQIHCFNGYEMSSESQSESSKVGRSIDSVQIRGHEDATSDFTSLSKTSYSSPQKSVDKPYGDENDPEMNVLMNYHMNLNRYLNLILYKLILPSFSAGTSEGKGKFSSNKNGEKNLDHLIWLFFNVYNKLIPILDFELFYNDYLTFINKYTLKNSTYVENGETKKRYYDFSSKEQDLLVKLILILKFTIAQPKGSGLSSIPDGKSFNQLDESLKLINLKNLKLMFRNMNFTLDLTMDRLEVGLMLFYYLIKFENYNVCPMSKMHTSEQRFKSNFLRDVALLCLSLKDSLHFNRDVSHLSLARKNGVNHQIIKIQRLKIYWDFRILIGLAEVYFNIDFDSITPERESVEMRPQSLESIRFVSPDIEVTLQLVNLLDITPKNILELCVKNEEAALESYDQRLKDWISEVNSLQEDENVSVFNKLKTYYYYFKIVIHLNKGGDALVDACSGFIDTAYELIYTGKNTEVSVENAEGLSQHSFNFHLMCMVSIIMLGKGNSKSRDLSIKLLRISQLYQLLISIKDVEPIICDLTKYVSDNVALNTSSDTISHDMLGLFSYSMTPSSSSSSSLFAKNTPVPPGNSHFSDSNKDMDSEMAFDLSAFKMSSDSRFMPAKENPYKRTKRSQSPTSSISAVSSGNSSGSSKRLSVCSNDTTVTPVPLLFPSLAPRVPKSLSSVSSESNAAQKRRRPYFDDAPASGRLTHSEELSHATKVRSMSIDSGILPSSKAAPADVTMAAFSRSASECGTNNHEPGLSIPHSFSNLFNEFNLSMASDEDMDFIQKSTSNERSTLPTIPSESNLEESIVQGSGSLFPSDMDANTFGGQSDLGKKQGMAFKDNEDLNRLRRRVLNMRASMTS